MIGKHFEKPQDVLMQWPQTEKLGARVVTSLCVAAARREERVRIEVGKIE
jgi:hypothetical protein